MFEEDRLWPKLSDEALRALEPGDQSPLPRSERPSQHWRAHSRAELDQRHNIVQIMAVIVLVRPGDQQMLAGDARRARESLEMEPPLKRSVRQGPPDDRLYRRQVPRLKGAKERMAPDATLRRNQKAEGWKPILIDKVLERHRRRMSVVINVMDAFGVRRIDAERM